jgi:hypothetical protein
MSCLDLSFDDLDKLAGGRRGRIDSPCPSTPTRGKAAVGPARGLRIIRERDDFIALVCSRCGVAGGVTRESTP